jgi:hypothetical protein
MGEMLVGFSLVGVAHASLGTAMMVLRDRHIPSPVEGLSQPTALPMDVGEDNQVRQGFFGQ